MNAHEELKECNCITQPLSADALIRRAIAEHSDSCKEIDQLVYERDFAMRELAKFSPETALAIKHEMELQRCGKGYASPGQVRVLREALEYAGCHDHEDDNLEQPCSVCQKIEQALDLIRQL